MSKPSRNNQTVGAFVLNNEALYPWTIYVHVPGARGGKEKLKFKAEFRHLSSERRLQVLENFKNNLKARTAVNDAPQSEDAVDTLKDVASFEDMILDEALQGFSGIVDAQGDALPYNEETKKQLISNSWARDALLFGYQQSLVGRSDLGN